MLECAPNCHFMRLKLEAKDKVTLAEKKQEMMSAMRGTDSAMVLKVEADGGSK